MSLKLIKSRPSRLTTPLTYRTHNVLLLQSLIQPKVIFYDSDGGPKAQHDNDHAAFELISILPTADEILGAYKPVYMPKKFEYTPNPHSTGTIRHRDLLFRQLRHENIQPVKDICNTAAQIAFVFRPQPSDNAVASNQGYPPLPSAWKSDNNATQFTTTTQSGLHSTAQLTLDLEEVQETSSGNRFYLYQDAEVEELVANEKTGVLIRISFHCPYALRGSPIFKSNRLQKAMMVALLCHNKVTQELHVYYLAVHTRQSTMSMNSRGGQGRRAAVICELIPDLTKDDVLDLTRYTQGLEPNMEFCLVEFPRLMHHGFYHCLRKLQSLSEFAFSKYIAPERSAQEVAEARVQGIITRSHPSFNVEAPVYARTEGFKFDLSAIVDGPDTSRTLRQLQDNPQLGSSKLDDEQSKAFQHCLTNEFAFVQGPPGTGKTYLGVKLAQVLLASRSSKPVLVVCLNNHALDNFLSGILNVGVKNAIRVGSGSKEDWTDRISLRVKSKGARHSPRENGIMWDADRMSKSAFANIMNWCRDVPLKAKPDGNLQDLAISDANLASRTDDVALDAKQPHVCDPEAAAADFAEEVVKYTEARQKFAEVRENVDVRILGQASIIALTTTACANRWDVLRRVGPEIVIFEEAAAVMEAHALCALLPTVQHAISIGDPRQLRPEVSDQILTMEKQWDYRLDESLFERLVSPCDDSVSKLRFEHLGLQRRMHPEIADLSRIVYPFLRDHESTKDHEPTFGLKKRVYWWDHTIPEREETEDTKSHINDHEVAMVTALVQYLVTNSGYSQGDIAVLTPYTGQLAALHKSLSSYCKVWLNERDRQKLLDEDELDVDTSQVRKKDQVIMEDMLRVTTVDNFQGEEAKVVILSTVRSGGSPGFLAIKNRITVACSRARDGFYIIGNCRTLNLVDLWRDVIKKLGVARIGPELETQCSNHPEHCAVVTNPEDFAKVVDCPALCQEKLECGHLCARKCHPMSLHERGVLQCEHRCEKVLKCGHQCMLSCGVPCGACLVPGRPTNLSCGHVSHYTCSGKTIVCDKPVGSVELPCGHVQKILCGQNKKGTSLEIRCDACTLGDGSAGVTSEQKSSSQGDHASVGSISHEIDEKDVVKYYEDQFLKYVNKQQYGTKTENAVVQKSSLDTAATEQQHVSKAASPGSPEKKATLRDELVPDEKTIKSAPTGGREEKATLGDGIVPDDKASKTASTGHPEKKATFGDVIVPDGETGKAVSSGSPEKKASIPDEIVPDEETVNAVKVAESASIPKTSEEDEKVETKSQTGASLDDGKEPDSLEAGKKAWEKLLRGEDLPTQPVETYTAAREPSRNASDDSTIVVHEEIVFIENYFGDGTAQQEPESPSGSSDGTVSSAEAIVFTDGVGGRAIITSGNNGEVVITNSANGVVVTGDANAVDGTGSAAESQQAMPTVNGHDSATEKGSEGGSVDRDLAAIDELESLFEGSAPNRDIGGMEDEGYAAEEASSVDSRGRSGYDSPTRGHLPTREEIEQHENESKSLFEAWLANQYGSAAGGQ